MANVQTIPVKELESVYAHYSKKMSEASEALEKPAQSTKSCLRSTRCSLTLA